MTPDLLVVGAGPAGVSAALWAGSLGLTARVLESAPRPGGQLHHVHFHPPDLAAVTEGDGPAIAAALARQLEASGAAVRCDAAATALTAEADGIAVTLSTGERETARAALVATGVRRRHLEVPGERELEGRGVSFSATRDRDALAGHRVLVVGGGDGAFENALILADAGCAVTLAVRGRPRARAEFRDRVAASGAIEVAARSRVVEILGDGRVEGARLEGDDGPRSIAVEGVVVKIGVVPNTEWCRGALACDEDGFVRADPRGRTSLDGVWAAGDVVRPPLPSLAVAIGGAALAVADARAALRGG